MSNLGTRTTQGSSSLTASRRRREKRDIRISFTREELVSLEYALESFFDEFAPTEGHLIERESALYERLQKIRRKRDGWINP